MDNHEFTTTDGVKYAGEMARWTLSDGNNLMNYLCILARFPDYSLNNQMLIMGYKPDAVLLKGIEEWNQLGVSINDVFTPVYIIEPDQNRSGFHWKLMCDVTDTDYQYQHSNPDKLLSLEALLMNQYQSGNIEIVDKIKGNIRALYSPKDKKIFVMRSSNTPPDEFFTAIICEFVHANFASKTEGVYPRSVNTVTAVSTAYAMGYRYGMEIGNINLTNLPERFVNLSAKDARSELEKIRENFSMVNENMEKALQQIQKKREGLQNERYQA